MNIDFPPPSKGTYNNAGSSRKLASYLEHEDLERMEKGIYTDGFFNLTEESLYKSQVIKDIDNNKAQLLKTDAKFYAIHVSPSAKELQAMGETEQEQAEAMRKYIREVFIPTYAENFNKGLSANDIKFYGKIHFDRDRSENNDNNMHCHIIVSRKDQANKIKLSPLTNHRNTKKGAIKGGFDRTNLFQQTEQGFDKLFNYDRPFYESFKYYNIMKNVSISDQLKRQEEQILDERKNTNTQTELTENRQSNSISDKTTVNQVDSNEDKQSFNFTDLGLSSALDLRSPEPNKSNEEQSIRKAKKRRKGLGR